MEQANKPIALDRWKKILFVAACGFCMVMISMVRSEPVYGKLDFILVDSKNWWHEMRPMFEEVLTEGSQPIITDWTTGFIFERCFGQELYEFGQNAKYLQLNIFTINRINRPFSERASLQSIYTLLLLADTGTKAKETNTQPLDDEVFAPEPLLDQNEADDEEVIRPKRPYRCVVNLKGFTPTWVPKETRHWPASMAQTLGYYYLPIEGGEKPITNHERFISRLESSHIDNCQIYDN